MITSIGGLPRPYGILDFTRTGLRGVSMQQLSRRGIQGLGVVDLAAVNSLQQAKNQQMRQFANDTVSILTSKGYPTGIVFSGGEYNGAYVSPLMAEIQIPKLGGAFGINYYYVSAGWTPLRMAVKIIDELTARPESLPMQLPQAPVTQVVTQAATGQQVNVVAPSTNVNQIVPQTVAPTQQIVVAAKPSTTTGTPVNNIASNATPVQTAAEYDPFALQQVTQQQQTRIVDSNSQPINGEVWSLPTWAKGFTDILSGSYFLGIPNWMLGIGAIGAYMVFKDGGTTITRSRRGR